MAQAQARTEARLDDLVQVVRELSAAAGRNTDAIAEIKGSDLEERLRNHPERMGLRRLIRQARLVERDEVEAWLEEAGQDSDSLVPVDNRS
ncbi:MAG: hypothetical protein ACRD0L_08535 [Acidimicrobiales bacterium]